MKSFGSSSLDLQMRLANLAISNVASAATMFQCSLMAHMKSWETFKVSNIVRVTSGWDWRHPAGGSWTLRESPSVRMSWSAKGSAFLEVLWSFGIESNLLLMIWLWTLLELRMPRYQSLPRCCRCLKFCDWFTDELVYQLWSQFTLTDSRMNLDVTWSRMSCWLVISCSMFLRIHVHWLIGAGF